VYYLISINALFPAEQQPGN